jgi:hypothetical protein
MGRKFQSWREPAPGREQKKVFHLSGVLSPGEEERFRVFCPFEYLAITPTLDSSKKLTTFLLLPGRRPG